MDSQGTDGLSATSSVALSLPQASARLRFAGNLLFTISEEGYLLDGSRIPSSQPLGDYGFFSQRRSLCILAVDIVDVDCLILLNRLQQSFATRQFAA
jgi:hypothetical protein